MNTSFLSQPSILRLESGNNFRDLGGNRGADNRPIKHGLLFRSGSLDKLSEKDLILLAENKVKHIIDYRDKGEAQANPDKLWNNVHYYHVPANSCDNEKYDNWQNLITVNLSTFNAQNFMLELYRHLPFNNLAYKQLVELLKNPVNGGIVQHCTVGKDRTGVGSALVLFALGLMNLQLLKQMASQYSDQALNQLTCILSAKEEFIQTALSNIRQRYGSNENWLEQEYGLDQTECEKLREHFLT